MVPNKLFCRDGCFFSRLSTHPLPLLTDASYAQWWISCSFATRRAENIESTKKILLDAVKSHPKEPVLYYNLACYECQLGDLTAAKKYLDKTFRLEPKIRIMALDDGDLMPLWLMLDED